MRQPQTFPNAVANHKSAVEDRHFDRMPSHELAVEADQHPLVSGINTEALTAGHRLLIHHARRGGGCGGATNPPTAAAANCANRNAVRSSR
jgi:hypothetical protein